MVKIGRRKKRFCPKGHDTFIVGRTSGRSCKTCHKTVLKQDKWVEYHKKYSKTYENTTQRLQYLEDNKEAHNKYNQKYYKNNHIQLLTNAKKYYNDNAEKIKEKASRYRYKNREKILVYLRKYREENKDVLNRKSVERCKIRLKTDVKYKLAFYLRCRIRTAIKRNFKSGSAVRDLGCSIDFLKKYLSSLFYSGMTWDNWRKLWELDHIKPLSLLDLTNRKKFLEACYYTNLQPLTKQDHLLKTIYERKNLRKFKNV